ncbi:universal stress protein [Paenibacillus sp. WLX1005]|uniref:universal stress protein n=1 Tax=unclassified Paenibacillus TaxID=185978 RepID=UPI00398436FA
MHEEKIMVGVHYNLNGERLIRRGIRLAQLLQAPLIVLSILDEPVSELDMDDQNYYNSWKKLTEEAGGNFMVVQREGRDLSEAIATAAHRSQVTQLIIGQSVRSFWEEMTGSSLINDLLEQLGAIDLHIVAVQRMKANLEETHEDGVEVDVIHTPKGYQIRYETDKPIVAEGVFFKKMHTDFENGLLKLHIDGEYQYLKVSKGTLVDAEPLERMLDMQD